ncbi:MAG: hypothetical protein WCD76_14085 [Pyrinomonadaceae bacterium]
MKKFLTFLILIACVPVAALSAKGQTASPSPAPSASADSDVTATYVLGDITSIDAASRQLTIHTKAGDFTVRLSDNTKYLRLAPGEDSLSKATPITLADAGMGDRVLARGPVSIEQRSVPARQLIIMNKAAIAEKQQRAAEEWRRRGIVGRIAAVNPATKEITLSTVTAQGETSVIIEAKGPVIYRRYLPDTVRFTDASMSSFEQLAIGDQVRALGNRQADGSRFVAEEVVSGAFRVVNGVVTAVNLASNEMTIKDLATEAPLTISVSQHSLMRRLSPEIIELIKQDAATVKVADKEHAAAGQNGSRDVKALVEQLPAININDLKVGDTVRVSSTVGSNPTHLTAIAVAVGIESLLNASKGKPTMASGGNSLGLSSGALDGIGLP